MTDFNALGLSASLLRALEKQDFTTPTEIQAAAIPPFLKGRDLIGLADTGTGKTAAFLLPMLERLEAAPVNLEAGAPRALILAPTRELAQQIGEALNGFGASLALRSTVIFGGAPMHKQLAKLKAGVDVLVATPGRLMDHVRRGSVRFDQTGIFILDEADRMLDMGFVGDVKAISAALPKPHQTVLFSATINKSVEKLTKELLNDPVRVDIAREVSVSAQVQHSVMHLQREDRKALLINILKKSGYGQTIIFTKTKRGADKLSRDLAKTGLKTDAIHGDRNQRQRQRTLNNFRKGAIEILIATDVAARGIDVPGIARVINFDLPLEPEAYIHRVGRTGRNGATGVALSFCAPDDLSLLKDIEYLLKQPIMVDADHEFHQDPPERAPKPQRKKAGRSGQPRRFKAKTTGRAGTKPARKQTAKPAASQKPGKRAKPQGAKPHRKGTSKPRSQNSNSKRRGQNRSRRAA